MKKIFFTAILLLSAILTTSCADKNSNKVSSKSEEKITLIFATQDTPDSPSFTGYQAFADKIYELSNGTMVVEFTQMIKFSGVEEMLNCLVSEEFDLAAAGYTNLDYLIHDLFILSQAVKDFDHFMRILDSPFGRKLQKQFYEVGVVASAPWYMGSRHMTSNTPINELADFKKIKMRTVPTEAGQVFASHMGAEIVPLNFPELYDALKNGTVDAQENPLSTIEAAKLYEHQKYIAMTKHTISITAVFLSREKYDTFTIEQKAWYNEAIMHGGEVTSQIIIENEANLLDKLVSEYGMTVTYPNLDELHKAMQPHYDSLIEKYGSVISELLEL